MPKTRVFRQRDTCEATIAGADSLHPVLARVLGARQVTHAEQLDYRLDNLYRPQQLTDIDRAVVLLAGAIEQDKSILVVGDFDADGATSCALSMRALRAMGATRVDYLVPNRFEFGYGLTPEIVEVSLANKPDLILTVDNGIASIEGVDAAHQHGIEVVITDHHLPGAQLPAADAIVNPNQPGDSFPSKALAGVGVVFYLLSALRGHLREQGWFAQQGIEEPNLAQWLDLVALGTVADLVPLDYNNRILVAQGLARINRGQCVPGILAMLELAGRPPGRLTSASLGFVLGPRLNAAGRLEDMSIGIECLLADTPAQARPLAQELESINAARRELQQDMQQQASEAVQQLMLDESVMPTTLCLYDSRWHQGIVGLVASRLKEDFHRPAIAFADDGDDMLKGSARSIDGLHIRDTLDAIATAHPGLLSRFGGHAMAAGLSLAKVDLDRFRQAFEQEAGKRLDEAALQHAVLTDGELAGDDMGLELAELIRQAGPWGQRFPEPVFEGEFRVLESRVVGQTHLKLVLAPPGGDSLDAIAFGAAPEGTAPQWSHVKAAYRLDVNEFRGKRSAQLMIEYLHPITEEQKEQQTI